MPVSKVSIDTTDSLPAEDFKAVFRGHPGGVSVITADAGQGPVALTATSVASISVDPPLLVFSISALSSAAVALTRATSLVVHIDQTLRLSSKLSRRCRITSCTATTRDNC